MANEKELSNKNLLEMYGEKCLEVESLLSTGTLPKVGGNDEKN